MSFLANIAGSALGLLTGNIANKQTAAAQQAQQNYAQGISAQAYQSAQQTAQQQLANAFARLNQFNQSNPNPALSWGNIQGPAQYGGVVGGQQRPMMGGIQPPAFMTQQQPMQGMPQMPQGWSMPQARGQQQQPYSQDLSSLIASLYPGQSAGASANRYFGNV